MIYIIKFFLLLYEFVTSVHDLDEDAIVHLVHIMRYLYIFFLHACGHFYHVPLLPFYLDSHVLTQSLLHVLLFFFCYLGEKRIISE